jgi:hypothetical protein
MMGLKYSQIAGKPAINAYIYRCFDELDEITQRKFVKRFRQQQPEQVMHTFRELILGAYLHSIGFNIRYELRLQGKTPDWVITAEDGLPQAIIELMNFHLDLETSMEIKRQLQEKPVAGYWPDGNKNISERLYSCLATKAQTYLGLATESNLPYTIAIYCEPETTIEREEIRDCLEDQQDGVFNLYPAVSGVLFFVELGGRYHFHFLANPHATRAWTIPGGIY